MNDWWKNPVLQGPDNEYGEYDYLIEELPQDHCEWSFQRYTSRCESCGKERYWLFRSTHYFYCWDGWDSMTYTECWKCVLKNKLWGIKNRIKKEIKIVKDARELTRAHPIGNFRYYYKLLKEMRK